MKTPRVHRIHLTTGPGLLETLRQELRRALVLDVRYPEARALTQLVVEATVANIQEHGYEGHPGHPITIEVRARDTEVFGVTIRDRAPRLDLERLAPSDLAPTPDPGEASPALMGSLTRKLVLRRRTGGGNVLRLDLDPAALQRAVEDEMGHAA